MQTLLAAWQTQMGEHFELCIASNIDKSITGGGSISEILASL
jgi:hypothetical protein